MPSSWPPKTSSKAPSSSGSTAGFRQQLSPSGQAAGYVGDLLFGEEVRELDAIHRINGPHEVLFVAIRNGGIDAHAALVTRIGRRPFAIARRHALGRHECLAAAARRRIEDVGMRVHAGRD